MAAHVIVVHTTARTHRVNVSPNTHLSDVLEDASRKFKIDASAYSLKYGHTRFLYHGTIQLMSRRSNNKTVDLSRTFRLSGLSSGAKLQLIQTSRSPSVVSVALQLPESSRLVDKFPSNTTIWQVLRRFEEGAAGGDGARTKIHITDRGVPATTNGVSGAGRLFYEQPVLHVVHRTLSSFTDLQKTLGQLGFSDGNVMLRLSFQRTDIPLEEAIMQHQNYFTSSQNSTQTLAQSPAQDLELPEPPTKHTLHPSPEDTAMLERPSSARAETRDTEMADPPGIDLNSTVSPGPQVHIPDPVPLVESLSDPSIEDQSQNPPSEPPASGPAEDAPTMPSQPSADPALLSQGSPPLPPSSQTTPPPEPSTARSFTAFRPSTSSTPIAASSTPYNPSDYTPTIEHAQSHQRNLQQSSLNRRLPTDAELAASAAAKQDELARISTVNIRVRFPNQEHVEARFGQADTGGSLYAFVREHLAPRLRGEVFVLKCTTDAKRGVAGVGGGGQPTSTNVPDTEAKRLIWDLGFKGRVLVTFVWDEGKASMEARGTKEVLRRETREGAREMVVKPVLDQREEQGIKVDLGGKGKGKDGDGGEGEEAGQGKAGKKVPKWMQKLVKK